MPEKRTSLVAEQKQKPFSCHFIHPAVYNKIPPTWSSDQSLQCPWNLPWLPQVKEAFLQVFFLTMSASTRNSHLLIPGLSSLIILAGEPQTEVRNVKSWALVSVCMRTKCQIRWPLHFTFFIKYQQLLYFTNSWYWYFLLMLELLLLTKVFNAFIAKT